LKRKLSHDDAEGELLARCPAFVARLSRSPNRVLMPLFRPCQDRVRHLYLRGPILTFWRKGLFPGVS
jgi:hypothetical protein